MNQQEPNNPSGSPQETQTGEMEQRELPAEGVALAGNEADGAEMTVLALNTAEQALQTAGADTTELPAETTELPAKMPEQPVATPELPADITEQPAATPTAVVEQTAYPEATKEPGGGGGFNTMLISIIVVAVLLVAVSAAVVILFKPKKKKTKKRKPGSGPSKKAGTGRTDVTKPAETQVGTASDGKTAAVPGADATHTQPIAPMGNTPRYDIGRAATIGGRKEQQDSMYYSFWEDPGILAQRGLLVAVADGIGGLSDGALASSTAMMAMQNAFAQNTIGKEGSNKLLALAATAQREVLRLNQSGRNCGCTLVTVLIEGWNMYLLSVGDSRIYLYRGGGLIVLNREHTLRREQEERMEVWREQIPAESLRRGKAITSHIGKANLNLIDRTTVPLKLLPGDKIALMSDGVFGTLSENEICEAMRKDAGTAAKEMIEAIDARNDPRQDNATVVVIDVQ